MDNDEKKEKQGSSLVYVCVCVVWVNKCDLLQRHKIILSAAGCSAGRMMNTESSWKKGRNATERPPGGRREEAELKNILVSQGKTEYTGLN